MAPNRTVETVKTKKCPNGGYITTHTWMESDGSKTVVVTKRRGDKSVELWTEIDETGATTSSDETLTNISESELEDFLRSFDRPQEEPTIAEEIQETVKDAGTASMVEDEKEASNAAEVRKESMKTDAQDEDKASSQAESSNYSVRRTDDLSEEDMLHLEMLTLLIRRARINQRPGDTHQLAHLLYDCLMPDFIDSDISEYESTDSEEETLEEISGKKFHKTKENERD